MTCAMCWGYLDVVAAIAGRGSAADDRGYRDYESGDCAWV